MYFTLWRVKIKQKEDKETENKPMKSKNEVEGGNYTQRERASEKQDMEKEMATHSSVLAWKSAWTEEPGGLQSMRSHDWECVHKGGGR